MKNKINIKLLFRILLFFLIIKPDCIAQWIQMNSPEGGYFREIFFIGDELVAVSIYDIYVSKNEGASWDWRSASPVKYCSKAFIDGSNIFLLGEWGVFMSSDNGLTWSDRSTGLFPQTYPISITRMDSLLFFGGQVQPRYSEPYFEPYGVLFKSSDNGISWKYIQLPFVQYDMAVNSLLSIGSILIAGGQHAIYRSTDRGLNWIVVADSTRATDLVLYNNTILASTKKRAAGPLRSTNSGESWFPSPGNYEDNFRVNNLIKSGSNLYCTLFDEVYRSTDAGISWEKFFGRLFTPGNYLALVVKGSLILVSNDNSGLFRSTDYGTTWSVANKGIGTSIYNIYAEDNLLLASTFFPSSSSGYLFRSTDSGNTWAVTEPESGNSKTCFLRVKDKLFAGTEYGGIEVSSNNGAKWITTGLTDNLITSLAAIDDIIFAGSSGSHFLENAGLYISQNQGSTWDSLTNGLPNSFYVTELLTIPGSQGEKNWLFTASYYDGIFRSGNGGADWIECNPSINSQCIWTLAAIPARTNSGIDLFAGTHDDIYISTDLGDSWNPLNHILTYNSSLTLFSFPEIPGLDSLLFALTDFSGIFKTSDHGQSWKSIADNIVGLQSYSIDVSSGFFYAATSRGVWKRPLWEITSILKGENSFPVDYALLQNYPNPFNPSTTIKYSIPKQSYVTLKVYDILGKDIVNLINEQKPAGNYQVEFNAANLPSGVYFYRIQAGSFNQVRKMLLIK